MPSASERYTLMLEAYLIGCGDHVFELGKQLDFVSKLGKVAELVKTKKKGRQMILQKELGDIKMEEKLTLPLKPTMQVSELNVSRCKTMDSFTVPLWLEFTHESLSLQVIFKSGDDLRADMLTLQMFRLMDTLWKEAGLDLHLTTYSCTATDLVEGFIEVVPHAVTTASIQKEQGVVTGALKKTPLAKWLKEQNPLDHEFDQAVENFTRSLAGYCVATYILGIGDRHNDNIMITKCGHLFRSYFVHLHFVQLSNPIQSSYLLTIFQILTLLIFLETYKHSKVLNESEHHLF